MVRGGLFVAVEGTKYLIASNPGRAHLLLGEAEGTLVRGRVDIYEQRSEYQFVVEAIEPQGHGALQLAFEQLKKKLRAEGLFEASRKRPLPRFPSRIGIVSSPKGAVIRDFIEILSRRFPGAMGA